MTLDNFVFMAATEIEAFNLPKVQGDSGDVGTILNIVFGIGGALALLVLVVSGLRYITSAGDPQKTSKAKNGVIYAVIGLALLIISRSIVSYVVNNL